MTAPNPTWVEPCTDVHRVVNGKCENCGLQFEPPVHLMLGGIIGEPLFKSACLRRPLPMKDNYTTDHRKVTCRRCRYSTAFRRTMPVKK